VVAALETGRSSWTALLDAVRLGPDHDPTAVTAAQVREVYGTARAQAWARLHPRLTRRGAWAEHAGELPIVEGTLLAVDVSPWLRPDAPTSAQRPAARGRPDGDPDILVVFDAGYDVCRLAFLLADLPVEPCTCTAAATWDCSPPRCGRTTPQTVTPSIGLPRRWSR